MPPRTYVAETNALDTIVPQPADDITVVISILSPQNAALLAWASVIDNRTGDPVFHPAVTRDGSGCGATAK